MTKELSSPATSGAAQDRYPTMFRIERGSFVVKVDEAGYVTICVRGNCVVMSPNEWHEMYHSKSQEPPSATLTSADAERYRWLNRKDNFLLRINDKPTYLKCGGEVLDRWIDARIEEESK